MAAHFPAVYLSLSLHRSNGDLVFGRLVMFRRCPPASAAREMQALSDVRLHGQEKGGVAVVGESGSGGHTAEHYCRTEQAPSRRRGRARRPGAGRRSRAGGIAGVSPAGRLSLSFQEFNLLDTFSVQDNIFLPLVLAGKAYPEMAARLAPIARQLGIAELLQKFPYELSGGQKRRVVAVWFALIARPKLRAGRRGGPARSSSRRAQLMCLLRLLVGTERGGPDHQYGAALGQGGQPRLARAVHQGRRGVPPDLSRRDADQQLYQKFSGTLTMLATGGDAMR